MPRRIPTRSARHLGVVGSFTMMLTALFYLAHEQTPYASRIIGWQAYDKVDISSSTASGSTSAVLNGAAISLGAELEPDELNLPSFPLDAYAPFLPNPAPITDIAVESCLPLAIKSCTPRSTPEEDARLGKWVRVDRSLDPTAVFGASTGGVLSNLFGTIDQRYLFYRKSRRTDVRNVVEVKLVESGVDENPSGPGWHRVKKDLRSKYMRMWAKDKNMHLYFRTVGGPADDHPGRREATAQTARAPAEEAITEVDLVYGDNPPWPGFELAGVISPPHPALGASRVSLSIRRTPRRSTGTLPPTFRKDGSFKILQLADLHFSVNPEPCRDVADVDKCVAKNDTLRLIETWLDAEKPDLVVFSGDQLNGQGTSWDERSVIPLFVTPCIARGIPWAAILGNHDSESGSYTRTEQMRLLQSLPLSLSRVGPAEITGDGNYYIDLRSPFKDRTLLTTLWFFDSGTHAPKNKWQPWKETGYGWVHADQVRWWTDRMARRNATLRPYRPDGAEDLPSQPWRRRRRDKAGREKVWDAGADQGQTLAPAPSLIFMHIPVPEAFAPVDKDAASGKDLITGERKEIKTFEGGQSQMGIFAAILLQHANETGSSDVAPAAAAAAAVSGKRGGSVKMLCHGHMHLNEDCRRVDGVWICFAGGSSFAGYGAVGFKRRSRVVELGAWGEEVRTWHLVEGEGTRRIDEILAA